MAQASDEPRTEEASARQRAEARRRGEVARSPGLTAAGGLLVFALCAGWVGAQLWSDLQALMLGALRVAAGGAGTASAGSAAAAWSAGQALAPQLWGVATSVGSLLLALTVGAAASGTVQVGALFSLHAVSPARRRASAGQRLREAFDGERGVDAVLSSVRWLLLVAVLAWVLAPNLAGLIALPGSTPAAAAFGLWALIERVLLSLAIAGLFVGVVDLVLRRVQLAAKQRVGRRERRRQQREDEGDPELRAERRRRHAELATLADLERASVLVFDAGGWAVALSYDPARDAAPRVLARARGELAHQMRIRCETADIPVHTPPGLARELHRHAPGEPIAPTHYEPVAALLREARA